MDARLEVQVGADIKELNAALSSNGTASRTIKQFASEGGKSLQKVQADAKRTGVAFTGFSRVLQDAAFGPAAIANNLEGLGQDLKQLSQTAKDTGQSIGKTLIQSLTGAGGLNLALGGVTLALSLASFGLSAWTRLFGDNEKAVKKAKDETKSYLETLSDVRRANLEGAQSATQELVNLRLLYGAARDTTLAYSERVKAVKMLQEQYPSYFKNLSIESTLNGENEKGYLNLASAILAQARAKAASNLISQNTTRQLQDEQRIIDERILQNELQIQLSKEQSKNEEVISNAGRVYYKNQEAVNRVKAEIYKSDQRIFNLTTDQNILTGNNLQLTKSIHQEIKNNGVKVLGDFNKEFDKTNEKAKTFGQLLGLRELGYVKDNFNRNPSTDTGKVSTVGVKDIDATSRALSKAAIEAQVQLDGLNKSANEGIGNLGLSIVEGLGSAFEALTSGGNPLQAFGDVILSGIASFLGEFGKYLIKFGLAAGAFATLQKALLNPITAIPAATAAVAIGAVLVALSGAIGGLMSGGGRGGSVGSSVSTSGPSTPNFSNGPRSLNALSNSNGSMQLVASVSGKDLQFVLSQETNRRGRVG